MPRNKYQHRPLYIRGINAVPGRTTLDPGRLVQAAERRTGLSDFGPGDWRDGLDGLCASLEDEAALNTVGRISARNHLLQLLVNRLQLEAARSEDVRQQPIEKPVILTGLPRTGSTLLHNLLAQDESIRTPLTWEVMYPCPLPGRRRTHDHRRIHRTERMLRWVHRLAPRFRTVHPIGAELPQECIAITAQNFSSVEFHTTFNVPAYQAWLDGQDGLAAVRYHHRFLQHLQTGNKRQRWFLKAPAHIYNLDALAQVYPDARFVFTHRDPLQVAASIASHGVILRNAFSDVVDNHAVAGYWMRWWAEGWRRAKRFRAGEHPIVDLDYTELAADPLSVMDGLYRDLGLELTPEAQQRMLSFLAANPKDKHGRHRYTLEEFGLDAADVRQSFDVAG